MRWASRMMRDIERICEQPEDEDRLWFPEIAGSKDVMGVLKDVWANYRDESFILQFLSPRLMREWRMFHLVDNPDEPTLRIQAIHNEQGYRRVRQSLARHYDMAWLDPDIQVVDVDLAGDRRLELHHNVLNGILLQSDETDQVLQHLADLWGYGVRAEGGRPGDRHGPERAHGEGARARSADGLRSSVPLRIGAREACALHSADEIRIAAAAPLMSRFSMASMIASCSVKL